MGTWLIIIIRLIIAVVLLNRLIRDLHHRLNLLCHLPLSSIIDEKFDPHLFFNPVSKIFFDPHLFSRPLTSNLTIRLLRKASISDKNPSWHLSLLISCFHTHPITLLLEILGKKDAWAVPHLKFWRDRLPSPPKSPPMYRPSLNYRLRAYSFPLSTNLSAALW